MRSSRAFGVVVIALAIAATACGSSSGKATTKPAADDHSHAAGDHDMRCMETDFAGKNPKICGDGAATATAPYTLAHPLKFTPDGLIDPNSVDLSGVQGVTPAQEKEATDLLKSTIKILPRWSDPAVAAADGFQSIGDGLTGEEHMLHWDWIEDDTIFDPNHPESLVYKVDKATGTKTLEAAMYILPDKYTLDNTPSIDSPLVQFHQHDNLCFSPAVGDRGPRVAGLTDTSGNCKEGLTKFNPNIQVHVWIRANDCGPFAALLGVGAGQIAAGAERSCVHDHTKLSL
ncbi:MAG: hypothetical protein JJE46_14210 [Acidimicrobiia bacterium]|nr:hypothetical protein [Acidimicrobiia bacterium]